MKTPEAELKQFNKYLLNTKTKFTKGLRDREAGKSEKHRQAKSPVRCRHESKVHKTGKDRGEK